jgi:hypothetical protein
MFELEFKYNKPNLHINQRKITAHERNTKYWEDPNWKRGEKWSSPAIPLGRDRHAGASRARSGERKASQRNFIFIVPLDPAHGAGFAGHLPVNGYLN